MKVEESSKMKEEWYEGEIDVKKGKRLVRYAENLVHSVKVCLAFIRVSYCVDCGLIERKEISMWPPHMKWLPTLG